MKIINLYSRRDSIRQTTFDVRNPASISASISPIDHSGPRGMVKREMKEESSSIRKEEKSKKCSGSTQRWEHHYQMVCKSRTTSTRQE